MSDAKLRELERRWKETGAVADEAAYMQERVRLGELPEARVRLASLLEHPGACWFRTVRPTHLAKWGKELEAFDRDAGMRAAAAICHLLANTQTDSSHGVALTQAFDVWALNGGVITEDVVPGGWAADSAESEAIELALGAEPRNRLARIVSRAQAQLSAAAIPLDFRPGLFDRFRGWFDPEHVERLRLRHERATRQLQIQVVYSDRKPEAERLIRDTLRAELVPWALGYGDPLQARIAEAAANRDAFGFGAAAGASETR